MNFKCTKCGSGFVNRIAFDNHECRPVKPKPGPRKTTAPKPTAEKPES